MINTQSTPRMRAPNSLKKQFIKKWIVGLEICRSWKNNMTLSERKNAIKLSADVAMASSRDVTTSWSRAIIFGAFSQRRVLVEHVLGTDMLKKVSASRAVTRMVRTSKILRRSRATVRRLRNSRQLVAPPSSVAKRMVKKKTELLKRLVPGGEFVEDEASLIQETLDYILCLRAQVDVMRLLAKAAGA